MIWLAWRQFRASAIYGAAILIAVAIIYGITGPSLLHWFNTVVRPCGTGNGCASLTSQFMKKDQLGQDIAKLPYYLPALLGMFWGAPLVAREMETGTFRLAWTQSVTRQRWLVTRGGIVVISSLVGAGLLSLMVTWWSSPFDTLNHFAFGMFDQRDIVPIGYTAFAVTLGIAAGALLRRTVLAMGATLVGFVAVRYVIAHWIRMRLESPVRITTTFLGSATNGGTVYSRHVTSGPQLGDWVISNTVVNSGGHPVPQLALTSVQHCDGQASNQGFHQCIEGFHLRSVWVYQPASRYWSLQWREMCIFIAFAVLLSTLSVWWIRRRAI